MVKKQLRDRLKQKQKELKERSSKGNILFMQPDKEYRMRILNMGEENEFIFEATQFYLGGEIKGVISPASLDKPCAIMEAYEELKNGDDDEKELAKKFSPRSKYLALVALYKDKSGKELDDNNPRFVLLTSGVYDEIIDLYLDEDEWGDMTNPEDGYDIKIKRTGSGKTDTEYTVTALKNTPTPKEFRSKVFDLEEEIAKIIPSYEETQNYINEYLGLSDTDDDDEEEKPKKKKVVKKKKVLKKTSDAD